jgi:hypothetical protein
MSGEKEKSGWTVDTLKEYVETRIAESSKALGVAREELERRLDGLNELRQDVEKDRAQFVKGDVYHPAHEELRRQRALDAEKITVISGKLENNATDIAAMKSSLSWLTRLIIGAVILAIIAYVFQKMGR